VEQLLFQKSDYKTELKQKKELINNWAPDIIYVCSFGFRNWIHKYNVAPKAVHLIEHSELVSAIPNNNKKHLYYLLEIFSTILFEGQIYASKYIEMVFSKGIKHWFTRKKPVLYSPYAYNENVLKNYSGNLYYRLIEKFEKKKIILYMGTLSLNYGFLDIIKACQTLVEKRDDFLVLIMGQGRHKEIGEKYIQENKLEKQVFLLGYVPEQEVSTYFKLASTFVSPLYDTIQDKARCPSKLFMYIPFKKPIITCKIGEAKELFKDNGYYYTPGNISELALCIETAIDKTEETNSIDINKHSWSYRAKEFDAWIKKNYIIRK
jgi:glycosyltransferase involved in cell wall biosynthesis